jgi:putative transposase
VLTDNHPIESFNARLRDEFLDGEIFYSPADAKIVIESWRRHYNTVRPHGSLGYKPPAPEVFVPAMAARTAPRTHPAASRPPPALASRPSMH